MGCSSTNGCCSQVGMLWFHRKLSQQVAGNFEVRICKDEANSIENVAIETIELYDIVCSV